MADWPEWLLGKRFPMCGALSCKDSRINCQRQVAMTKELDGECNSGCAVHADEGSLDARMLCQNFARVPGMGVVDGARVHL